MTDSAALMTTPDYGGGNDEYKEEADEDFENFREGLLHKLPEPLLIDLDALEEKPWEKEGADINDYFNYGLDEHTFKLYQGKVRDNFSKLDREEFLKILKEKKLDLNHDQINFYLPHEAGGCGITKNEEYEVVNTYRIDTDDPPILCNKSYGYYAKITKNGMQKALEMQVEGGEEAMIDSNAYSHGRNDVNSIDGLPVRQGMINPRDLDHPKDKGKKGRGRGDKGRRNDRRRGDQNNTSRRRRDRSNNRRSSRDNSRINDRRESRRRSRTPEDNKKPESSRDDKRGYQLI